MVSNFRSFMDQEEDYLDMDMDMYDDDDHFDYYDYFYQNLNVQNKYMSKLNQERGSLSLVHKRI